MRKGDLKPGTVFYHDNKNAPWVVLPVHPACPYAVGDDPECLWPSNPGQEDREVSILWAPPADKAPKAPVLTTDKKARKEMPIARGVVDYFPRALAAIANVSYVANEQHNPGEPMHWDKSKSTDHADCIARHLIERGTVDDDGLRHSAKLAWRALALLETELSEQK